MKYIKQVTVFLSSILVFLSLEAQPPQGIKWAPKGNGYYAVDAGEIFYTDLSTSKKTKVITKKQLTPVGAEKPINPRNFFFSADETKLLIYTNSKKVWRYDTRGDYWVLD